jgi:hypothetical protein
MPKMLSEKNSSSSPDEEIETRNLDPSIRTGHNGIALLPYPSDDPQDPLVSLPLKSRRQIYLIQEFEITELAYEKKTQDPGHNLPCYLLRLFCLFGWTITSRTSIKIV